MLASLRCFRASELLRCRGQLNSQLVYRNEMSSRSPEPHWSTTCLRFSRRHCLGVRLRWLNGGSHVFDGESSLRRTPMDAGYKGSFFKHLNGFLWDTPSPRRTGPCRESSYFHRGHALLSTSAGDLRGPNQVGKQTQSNAVVKRPPDEEIADMRILRTLAKYLWLKDNLEFRLRVIMAMGLLVGAKVLNVQVPFLFKLAVDWLSTETGTGSELASLATSNSLLVLFASPAAVMVGYGIARAGASACNGSAQEVIVNTGLDLDQESFNFSCEILKKQHFFKIPKRIFLFGFGCNVV